MAIPFIKMHGLGNDYVYVDCFRNGLPADPAGLARAVSDRHFGIGGDGLILVCQPSEAAKAQGADARMRMFNADGSESEMCGNGLRCVAKLVHDHGICQKPRLLLETGRGLLPVDLEVKGGKVSRARVEMGQPILQAALIPTTLAGDPPIEQPVETPWGTVKLTCVSMGNPHAVAFVDKITDQMVHEVGKYLETCTAFPKRANIEFVEVVARNRFVMRVWERGSGETLACGTGACAVAVAGILTGRLDRRCTGKLLGGELELEWPGEGQTVYMTGPATEVFSGIWPD
jgi:diaminopimelate epimerase